MQLLFFIFNDGNSFHRNPQLQYIIQDARIVVGRSKISVIIDLKTLRELYD